MTVAKMKRIHNFAIKWCDKFRDQSIDYKELIDQSMADDCDFLGFRIEYGHEFFNKYGQEASEIGVLDKIIDDVTDICLLGSAIYYQWRYFSHWAYDSKVILQVENRAWFILALSRLAILSGENPFIFQGRLKNIHIVSNIIHPGFIPKSGEEVEQHIDINDQGDVSFSAYAFKNEEEYEKIRTANFKIEKKLADKLMNVFAEYFEDGYIENFTEDAGNWFMELTNSKGASYKFRGELCADFDYKGINLSDLVRASLGMNDLYVFDARLDFITRITLDYHRLTKIKTKEIPKNAKWEYLEWDYTEQLIIDRDTESLEHIQNIGEGCIVSHKYKV
jgi:hypothetical protein